MLNVEVSGIVYKQSNAQPFWTVANTGTFIFATSHHHLWSLRVSRQILKIEQKYSMTKKARLYCTRLHYSY